MTLHGAQQKQVQKVLLDAFDEAALRQMTRYELDSDLDIIAGGDDMQERTYNLIEWAVRNGRVLDLINGAFTANPGNGELQELQRLSFMWQPEPNTGTEKVSMSVRRAVAPEAERMPSIRRQDAPALTFSLFVGQWFLASMVGFVAGGIVGGFVFWNMEMAVIMAVGGMAGGLGLVGGFGVSAFTGGIFLGMISGGAQWTVLRQYMAPSYWWVLASVAALALGGTVGLAVSHDLDPTGGILGMALGLALYGLVQWVVLRKTTKLVGSITIASGEWALAMLIGWAAGMAVAVLIAVAAPMHLDMLLVCAAAMAVGGSIYGMVTGGTLFRLLQ